MVMSKPSEYVVGVDLGGTKILSAVIDRDYKIVGTAKKNTRTPEKNPAPHEEPPLPERIRGSTITSRISERRFPMTRRNETMTIFPITRKMS